MEIAGPAHNPPRRKSRSSANTSGVGGSSIGSSRPSTADGLPPRVATPRSSVSGSAARSKSAGGVKARKKKSSNGDAPVHQYSASFHEGASSYSNIVGMNTSLVPNRHGEPIDANLRPSVNLSAYGTEIAGNFGYPVRQSMDSLNNSLQSAGPLSSSGLLHGGHPNVGTYAQQASGYVPGTYVPGLGTPTLAAHLEQQERVEAARAGRPPRHPTNGASPATTPTTRGTHSVYVPAVRNEQHVPASLPHSYVQVTSASATPSSAAKRPPTKTKTKKPTTTSAPPTPSSFVRRIPSASPARGASSPQLRRAAAAPSSSSSGRHASPNVRGGTAPSASQSSTFGVSRRIL